jgi:small subunit ribosomal protein S17
MSEATAPLTEAAAGGKATTRPLTGRVISDKMDKTVTVLVERRVKHPLYKKYIRRSTKIHAHDEAGECNVGDSVSIVQCRPLSRTKAWRVLEIIARAK